MLLLAEFALRIALGLSLALGLVSSRQVRADFFRVHLYVVLGLGVVAALALFTLGAHGRWPAVGVAAAAYVGSAAWIYQAPRVGKAAIAVCAALALLGAWQVAGGTPAYGVERADLGRLVDIVTSAALAGLVLGSMLLGHWYLNSPEMKLDPLRRLLAASGGALVLRAATAAVGLALLAWQAPPPTATWLFLALRWLAGIVGVGVVLGMTWHTLKIPNTQSATGILYAGVVLVAIGELVALLAAEGRPLPL